MFGFKALNIESDDESDIEIDNTKEIQIEEALKLYQTALKYHAEGPGSFEDAAVAYEKLFQSDIFQWPESQTELRRIELYGPLIESDDSWQERDADAMVVASSGLDGGPSTLPQILHLSHKNYGQFKLEYLTAQLGSLEVNLNQLLKDAIAALDHFVQALDKDDSDVDLWQRAAVVGETLGSSRVLRFCLEAVLDGDDEDLSSVLSMPGIDDGLAREKLRCLVQQLNDNLSLVQMPRPSSRNASYSRLLRNRLSLYPRIVEKSKSLRRRKEQLTVKPTARLLVSMPKSWAEVGDILLRQNRDDQNGITTENPSPAIEFNLSCVDQDQPPQVVYVSPADGFEDVQSPQTAKQKAPSEANPSTGKGSGPPESAASVDLRSNNDQTSIKREGSVLEGPTIILPARKRSGEIAGLTEGNEDGRTKSKRIRTRESTTAEEQKQAIIDANIRWEYEQQLNEFQAADDWMFDTVGTLYEKINILGLSAGKEIRQRFQKSRSDKNSPKGSSEPRNDGLSVAIAEMNALLNQYSDKPANLLLVPGDEARLGLADEVAGYGSTSASHSQLKAVVKPPTLTDARLLDFLETVNQGWMITQDVAWEWLMWLLCFHRDNLSSNTYISSTWPENLKTVIVRALVDFDSTIFPRALAMVQKSKDRIDPANQEDHDIVVGMVETIYELHLDIYCLIKQSNSGVEFSIIQAQGERLERWAQIARDAAYIRVSQSSDADPSDELNLRLFWATAFHLGASNDVTQDHVIECMNNLRETLEDLEKPTIRLQNNAIMPELSVAALDREISRLTTRDFFDKVTSPDESDPVSIIETVEPLLECLDISYDGSISEADNDTEPVVPARSPELVQYIRNSNISVRLLLWQRLRDAYQAIDYKPMVLRCYLRAIEMILKELKQQLPQMQSQQDRQILVVKSVSVIKTMMAKSLALIQGNSDALECVDDALLKASVSMFGEMLQLLQVFNVFEDSIRVGESQPPSLLSGAPISSFPKVSSQLREMQIHIWLIMYHLLKEAIDQNPEAFSAPLEDRFDFLRSVHRNLGLRGMCGGSNRAFVRLLKDEFFQMTHIEGYDSEQAQVLYDLYGLNCFLDPSYELIEHDCTHDAFLDRSVAVQVVDLLLLQASKLPIKDLVKHPLKDTIDKVHGSAPRKKPTDAIMRNREVYRAYLRSPINPLDLYNCLKGEGNELPISSIPREDALLASKGWYFLMGHIALTKFRSQKRTTPTPTEDVDIAIAFFMQDLEYSSENWETWFRLAQAYDTKVEESVVWSAEKLNSSMAEVIQLQRAALHCYTMATALAYRSAEPNAATSEKMTELYYDFALRIYASSREPFNMLPFAMDENDKFLSQHTGIGKGKAFQPLRVYTAWKIAKNLFQKSLRGRAQSWVVHYMLAKCLWKMHSATNELKLHDEPPTAEQVLDQIIKAIELVPDKNSSREKRDPVLEPHYKLVSIVHKLVTRNKLDVNQGIDALSHTPYGRTKTIPSKAEDWVSYILAVLKNLRTADKSNWHHRIIMRTAKVVYDLGESQENEIVSERTGAAGAKHELTQQMFTKTMVLQVWRPECERAGRHFVYTARYTRFFVAILEQLGDRNNIEMLARRVRRRPQEIFEHTLVWQDMCNAYLRMLRSYGAIGNGLETSTFSNIIYDDFLTRKEPLEKWMQTQDAGASPALDVLRDVQELKKINQSLMKPSLIDDLIGDTYAQLFLTVGKQLVEDERRQKDEEETKQKVEDEAQRPTAVAPSPMPAPSPSRNAMMNLTNLMNTDANDSLPSSARNSPPATTLAQSQAQAEPMPAARRKIGVGRREIRNCAEGCFQKSSSTTSTTTHTASSAQHSGSQQTRVQVVINSSRAGPGDASADTSAPVSVHDSGDDETELSELEDEEVEEMAEQEEFEADDEGGEEEEEEAEEELPSSSSSPPSQAVEAKDPNAP